MSLCFSRYISADTNPKWFTMLLSRFATSSQFSSFVALSSQCLYSIAPIVTAARCAAVSRISRFAVSDTSRQKACM